MTIRATLITAVNTLELRSGKTVSLQEVKIHLDVTSAKLGGALWQASGDGYLKKSKEEGYGSNRYSLTERAHTFLKGNHPVFSHEELIHWTEVGTRAMPKSENIAPPPNRYTGTAMAAMSGIAALVDTNEKLTNALKSLHFQIDDILTSISPAPEEDTHTPEEDASHE